MSDIVLPLGILRPGCNEKMKNYPGINTALYKKAVFIPGLKGSIVYCLQVDLQGIGWSINIFV